MPDDLLLLDQLNAIEDYGMQSFWDDDTGGCPCFNGSKTENGHTVHVDGNCWRVSDGCGDNEPWFQDLYVWGDHPDIKVIADSVKRALDAQEWYHPYRIIWEEAPSYD